MRQHPIEAISIQSQHQFTAENLTGLPMRSTIWLPEVRKYVKIGAVGAWVWTTVGLGITKVMLGFTGGSGTFLRGKEKQRR